MSSFTTQVIIDNITTATTTDDIILETTNIFKNKIKDINKLKKGGIIITPSHKDHITDITDIKNYPTETYGHNLYVHTTNNDNTRQPWLCINRLPYVQDNDEQQLNEIRDALNNITGEVGMKIEIIGLHRKYKGPLPTSLLLYKTTTRPAQDYLLNNTIDYKQNKLRTRLYINKTQIQCTNCNRLGHTKTNCTNEYKCVRCGESCPLNNCQNKNKRCTNCNGPHTATSRQCDKIRQHINKRYQQNTTLTYAQVLNKQQHTLDITQQQQQHKLDITQQQQNTKLDELHNSLQTAHKTILELQQIQTKKQEQITELRNEIKNTEAPNINITSQQNEINVIKHMLNNTTYKGNINETEINTYAAAVTDIIDNIDALNNKVTELQETQQIQQTVIKKYNNMRIIADRRTEQIKNYAEHLMTEVSDKSQNFLTNITAKLNEHIKHIEDFTYNVNPDILTQIHIYTKHLRHNNVDKISAKIMEITRKLSETTGPDTINEHYNYNIELSDNFIFDYEDLDETETDET